MLRRTAAAIAVATVACSAGATAVATRAMAAGEPSAASAPITAPNVPADTMCGARPIYTPFTAFGDTNSYWLMRGGDFEQDTAAWSGRNVRFDGPNEPHSIGGWDDSRSAVLTGSGATLEAPGLCVRDDEPTLRFFYRSPGVPGSRLVVRLRTWSSVGSAVNQYTLDGSRSGWVLSQPMTIGDTGSFSGMQWLNLSFATAGADATWGIDDIYVDPWKYRNR